MNKQLDIVDLLEKNPLTRFTKNYQSKFIDKIKNSFTDTQQHIFIGSFYCYLNYNSKTDFVIDLDNIWRWLGFSRKEFCKRVLDKYFIENIDYIIKKSAPPVVVAVLNKQNGGQNKETILMNINTFKKLCLKSNTKKSDEIHDYFIKLEDIFQEIISEESNELKNQLELKENDIKTLKDDNEEKQNKLALLTKKTNKFKMGQSLYIFESTADNQIYYKIGRTKNANERDTNHKTSSLKGIIYQVECVNSILLERIVHFLLDKYRCTKTREWFQTSLQIIKNCIYFAKTWLECDIDFKNSNLIDYSKELLNEFKDPNFEVENEEIENKEIEQCDIFTTLNFKPKDIHDFELFLSECFEPINGNLTETRENCVAYFEIKDQYKIWSKIATFESTKKMINFVKIKYKTIMLKYNPLVSSSKKSQYFLGLKIKLKFLMFENPNDDSKIIETFLFKKCQRAPGYRVTIQDLLKEFQEFYETNYDKEFSFVLKEKVKKYLDIIFIRSRSGDNRKGGDERLGGWLGFALKNEPNPEPIKQINKYFNKIKQVDIKKNIIVKEWNSITCLAEHLNKSLTITSGIITRHQPVEIDGIIYLFSKVEED